MKVLVVSDTHGRDESLEMAVALEQPFDYLIHCGDVEGREFFIEALAECPCTIVAGNNDFFSDQTVIGTVKTVFQIEIQPFATSHETVHKNIPVLCVSHQSVLGFYHHNLKFISKKVRKKPLVLFPSPGAGTGPAFYIFIL